MCGVITVAKRDLKAGETLDGIGGFMCYGLIDNQPACAGLLPIGLSFGCRVKADMKKAKAKATANGARKRKAG